MVDFPEVKMGQYMSVNVGADRPSPNISAYTKSYEFVNNTSADIWLVDHNNCLMKIPNNGYKMLHDRKFVIREVHQLNGFETIAEVATMLASVNQSFKLISDNKSRKLFEEAVSKSRVTTMGNNQVARQVIEYSVREEVLANHGFVFDFMTNFVMVFGTPPLGIIHPGSLESAQYYSQKQPASKESGISFEIVDPGNRVDQRFVFSANQVIRISVNKSNIKPAGLYVTYHGHGNINGEFSGPEFYSFDANVKGTHFTDGEKKYGLFKTYEEALTSGNPDRISVEFEKEMREQHRNKMEELEAQKREQKLEQELRHKEALQELERKANEEKQALEREKQRIELENLKLKQEHEDRRYRRDDFYDSRSSERKDFSELLKTISAVLTPILAIVLIALKAK